MRLRAAFPRVGRRSRFQSGRGRTLEVFGPAAGAFCLGLQRGRLDRDCSSGLTGVSLEGSYFMDTHTRPCLFRANEG